MKEIGIGLLGFGTVGAGVVAGLQRNGELIGRRLGLRPVLRRVADLDTTRDRGVDLAPGLLTTDAQAVVDDPAVQVVIELIGGTGVAGSLIRRALEAGKPVVTANKHLLAEQGAEIFALARRQRTDIFFGASVGGGIPIIRALREGLSANRIESIYGIVNGTCNYILTRMEQEGLGFQQALDEAQAEGYAEADPGLDIDGHDTAHKAAILAALAYGGVVPLEGLHVEGIRGLSIQDIEYARDLGYRIKLLAVIRRPAQEVELRVHPALVPEDSVLASVNGVFNAVLVRGDMTGDTLYYGRGAGALPTAATVLADVVDVIRNLASRAAHRLPAIPETGDAVALLPMERVRTRYYLRLAVRDEPGVLASITAILGQEGISLASVLQKEEEAGGLVPVVLVTHEAEEGAINRALSRLEELDAVEGRPVRLRIETA